MFTLALVACAPAKSPALSDTELIFSLFSPYGITGKGYFPCQQFLFDFHKNKELPVPLTQGVFILLFSLCFFFILFRIFQIRFGGFNNLLVLFAPQNIYYSFYTEKQHKKRKNRVHYQKRRKIFS